MPLDGDDSSETRRTSNTRRRFLAGSAALGGLALGTAFGAQPAFAQEGDDVDDVPPEGNATESEFEDDIGILNYALTLEYLEAAFYREALDNLDADDIECMEVLGSSGDEAEEVYEELEVIRDHEETHAEVLGQTIEDLGGEPVDEPEFDFGSAVEDPTEFIQTAAVLEDTGVSAYAGAAPSIENGDLVPPALSIHSVEARHASFVRELAGEIGFPNAFDQPLSKAEVLDAASQFIVDDMDEMMDEEDDSEDDDGDSSNDGDDSASGDNGDSSSDDNASASSDDGDNSSDGDY